jgi:aspartate/methionine/tyrosine aminotransferase
MINPDTEYQALLFRRHVRESSAGHRNIVAALSGTAFGEGYLRFSVANSIENIEKALDRVAAWAKKNL